MSTVLVLRALGLGDLLTGVPALRAIRREFRGARVVLAAPAVLAPLVEMAECADELLPTAPLAPIGIERPAIAINLHGRGPESHRVLLATKPSCLVAYAHRDVPESAGLPGWSADMHEVDRWCDLLRDCGIHASRDDLRINPPAVEPPPAAAGALLIHPGAASDARRWPAERWVEVARAEQEAGRKVAVSAGPGELVLAQRIARDAGLPEGAVVAGDLTCLASSVAAARAIACGDTGVAHLATALGTPSVVLFGPIAPALWGPPSWHPHVVLWSGRTGDPHAEVPDAGLLEITAGDVTRALERLGDRSVDGDRGLARRIAG